MNTEGAPFSVVTKSEGDLDACRNQRMRKIRCSLGCTSIDISSTIVFNQKRSHYGVTKAKRVLQFRIMTSHWLCAFLVTEQYKAHCNTRTQEKRCKR